MFGIIGSVEFLIFSSLIILYIFLGIIFDKNKKWFILNNEEVFISLSFSIVAFIFSTYFLNYKINEIKEYKIFKSNLKKCSTSIIKVYNSNKNIEESINYLYSNNIHCDTDNNYKNINYCNNLYSNINIFTDKDCDYKVKKVIDKNATINLLMNQKLNK